MTGPLCAKEKGGLPIGKTASFLSVDAPKGCDLLLLFGRSSSGVGGRSSSGGRSVGASGSSVGTGSGGFRTGGGSVGAFGGRGSAVFGNRVSGRSFGGGGVVSGLLTASGEGEHAGSNGDSSKLLHDVWAP
ncbi:MAG: hypothetical protein ABS88_09330 [Sphingopyxis sp. SCN 67-31]|nr:MAG: hypothetical protein ABS88_09330 [Sphingopyxis sp. SCN 67-31]